MKQIYITSANFHIPGDSGDPDAYIDPDDLAHLKQMAGLTNIMQPVIDRSKNMKQLVSEKKILREVRFDSTLKK
jgi:hypothetical protein